MSKLISTTLEEARRKIASGRALFRDGLMPESEACLGEALQILVAAWTPAEEASEPAEQPEPKRTALGELERSGYRTVERLKRALSAATSAASAAPRQENVVSADFETISAEAERLYGFSVRRLAPRLTPRQLRIRIGAVLGAVLLVAGVIGWRLWGRPIVTASAVYSWDHPASNAADGLEATEWLLPDRTPGWIELTFSSTRSVRRVRLLNAHNIYYMDRAAEKVRVTAYGKQGELASVTGRYAKLSGKRSPLDLNLKADGVTRIRVEVLSHFASGGGLAEIEVR